MALNEPTRDARTAGGANPARSWVARLGGVRGIALRLGLIALAVIAASEHVMRQSSLIVLAGFLLAGLILAAPLARYAAAWLVFSLARGLADDIGFPDQGTFFANVDRWLGFGVTPTERLQDAFHTAGQLGIIDHLAVWVHASYYVAPHLVAIGLWWFGRRNGSPLFDTYLKGVIGVMLIGILMYVLLPTSPPWLETSTHPGMDVTRIVNAASGNPTDQEQLYTVFTDPNPIAAMPSLHTAITVLAAWALWQRNRALGILATVYAVLMGASLVYLGEHYVIDVIAGLAVVAVVVGVMRKRTPSPPAPLP